MKVRKFIWVLLFQFFCFVNIAQSTFISTTEYPMPSDADFIWSSFLLPDSDGNYFMISNYRDNDPAPTNWNARIMKTDSDGILLNINPINIGSNGDDLLRSAIETSDSYIMAGSHSGFPASGNKRMWARKTDKSLATQWVINSDNGQDELGFTIEHAENGNFIVGGCKDGNPHCWIIQDLGTSGVVIDDFPVFGMDFLLKIEKNIDGDYYFFGANTAFGGCNLGDDNLENIVVQKRNSNFNTLFTKTLGGDTDDVYVDAVATNDGGFAVLAQTLSEATFGVTGEGNILGGIFSTNSFNNSGFNFWLYKGDSIGNNDWINPEGEHIFSIGNPFDSSPYGIAIDCEDNLLIGQKSALFVPSEDIRTLSILNGEELNNSSHSPVSSSLTYNEIKISATNEVVTFGQNAPFSADELVFSNWTADPNCSNPCASAFNIPCGTSATLDNSNASNNFTISDYSTCFSSSSPFDANDYVFQLDHTSSGNKDLTVTLLSENIDHDIFLLNQCGTILNCIASSTAPIANNGINMDVIEYSNAPADIYYVVVDGYNQNQEGPFVITYNCESSVCDINSYIAPLSCDTFLVNQEIGIGGENRVSSYCGATQPFQPGSGCTGWENLYSFTIDSPGEVTILLEPITPDTDFEIFLFDDCFDKDNCIASSTNPPDFNETIIEYLPAGDYILVVDVWEKTFDAFYNLELSCPSNYSCNDCLNCFYYLIDKDNPQILNCYNNYCPVVMPELTENSALVNSYEWTVENANGIDITSTVLNGSASNAENPICDFPNPGQYTICQKVYSEFGVLLYECCLIVDVESEPCHNPPVPEVNYSYNSFTGQFTLTASNSTGVDDYLWDYPEDFVFPIGNTNGSNFICTVIPNDCYTICLTGTNECGFGSYCVEICDLLNCQNTPGPIPEITPEINGNEVTFPDVPNGGLATWEWTAVDGQFIDGTNINTPNPVIEYDTCGNYIVCLKLEEDQACANTVCLCWTISIPPPDNCDDAPCPNWTTNNCPEIDYEYIGTPNSNNLSYSFSANGLSNEEDFCKWEVYSGNNANTGFLLNESSNFELTYNNFVNGQTYTVCYIWWDSVSGCLRRCCKTIVTDNPYECGNDFIDCDYVASSNQMQFSINGAGLSNIQWFDDLSNSLIGTGNAVSIPVPSDCDYYYVSVRYFDISSQCWYICCKIIWLCPPTDCEESIDYEWNFSNNNWKFTFNPSTLFDPNSIIWKNDNTGQIIGTGQTMINYNFSNCITPQTISVTYRDPNSNCWYVCCRTIVLCPPENCEDFTYFYNGTTIELELTASNIQLSSIEWKDESTGTIFAENSFTAIPVPSLPSPPNCIDKWISVKYFDQSSGCWYICCRRIRFCNPTNCYTSIDYYYSNDEFQFDLVNVNYDQTKPIEWTNDNTGQVFGTGTSATYSGNFPCQEIWISVRYYDLDSGCWRICCRRIYICPPENCENNIGYTDFGNGSVQLVLQNTNFNPNQISWYSGNNLIGIGTPLSATLPSDSTTKICVYYFDTNSGCWYICCRDITPDDCTAPIANFDFTTNENTVTFENTSISTEGGATYSWNFGDGSFSSLENPVHTFNASGFYEVCLTISDDCSEGEYCIDIPISPVSFCIGEGVCGASGQIVSVPVTVKNFDNVAGIQMTFNIDNPNMATFINTSNHQLPNLSSAFSILSSGTQMTLVWFSQSGISLSNNSTIFNIEILIEGVENQCSDILIGESPTPFFISDGNFSELPSIANAGSVCIKSNLEIAGQIKREATLEGVGIVEIELTGGANQMDITEDDGNYQFLDLPANQDYLITPTKNINPKNGVFVDDILIIQKFIGGDLNALPSPYKRIAADVNSDGNIFVNDLIILQQLIGGVIQVFPDNTPSWKFIPEDYVFTTINPEMENYPTNIELIQLQNSSINEDFIGVKMGDVNNSGDSNNLIGGDNNFIGESSLMDLEINIDSKFTVTDSIVSVPVRVNNFTDVGAIQFSLAWNANIISYQGVKNFGLNDLNESFFNEINSENGELTLVWFSADCQTLPSNAILFELEFLVTGTVSNTSDISITESPTPILFFDCNINAIDYSSNDGVVTIASQPEITACEVTHLNCFGENSGMIELEVIGGTNDYDIIWNTGQNGNIISNLSEGLYFATITDTQTSAVIEKANIQITTPPELKITSIEETNISCHGEQNGSATVEASGGTSSYSYDWGNNNFGETISNLSSGIHTITVTDSNGCLDSLSIEITEPDSISSTILLLEAISCFGLVDGEAIISANGGTGSLSYLWDTGEIIQHATELNAGLHSATVTDENGCETIQSINIPEPLPIILDGSTEAETNNNSNGKASIAVSGGSPPFNFEWSHDETQTAAQACNLSMGDYEITVTDDNDCIEIISLFVDNVVATDEISLSESINIYPNPAANYFLLDWENESLKPKGISNLEIFNSQGQLVDKIVLHPNQQQIEFNPALPDGAYFIQIDLGDKAVYKWLVIQK